MNDLEYLLCKHFVIINKRWFIKFFTYICDLDLKETPHKSTRGILT